MAKAIATELRWLPSREIIAVETLLLGKVKNTYTRTFSLARAVAQAYEWQLADAQKCVRLFHCWALERTVEDLEVHNTGQAVTYMTFSVKPLWCEAHFPVAVAKVFFLSCAICILPK